MGTHSDHFRRGMGWKLSGEWKSEKGGGSNHDVASPMGKSFYEKMGSTEPGVAHVQVEGENETLNVSVMAWAPSVEEGDVVNDVHDEERRRL